MKPLFNLPGVGALAGVLTFLSDNPAIISLANDKNFSKYFKNYQLVSLTNFGTAFGMGLNRDDVSCLRLKFLVMTRTYLFQLL